MGKAIYVGNTKVKKIYVGNTKVKKVYVGNTLSWTSAIAQDQGMLASSCKLTLGSGANNPISGGTANDWTIAFYFVWHSNKGGALVYHNYQQRESIIKLMDDGRIMVNANRYDTSSYKTWYSTRSCEVGKLNAVVVTRQGHIYINGYNATPSSYGGDMSFWGPVNIFPDRDINATMLGVQSWNWVLNTSYLHVSNPLTWPWQTDPSNMAFNFDGNTNYRVQNIGNGTKAQSGSPAYYTYEWNEDSEASQV